VLERIQAVPGTRPAKRAAKRSKNLFMSLGFTTRKAHKTRKARPLPATAVSGDHGRELLINDYNLSAKELGIPARHGCIYL
jgi:hypothetical protein